MSHYYTNETIEHAKQYMFSYTYKNQVLNFHSSSGVFSKVGVDFGTHLLIQSLPTFENKRILDVGCGVGVIGLALAKANPTSSVLLVDVNELAVELAQKNSNFNHIRNANAKISNLYESVEGGFDVIVSNPPIRAGKAIVHGIVTVGFDHLTPGGELFVVIQKKQGAPSMEKKIEEVFGNVETFHRENGYFVFRGVKSK